MDEDLVQKVKLYLRRTEKEKDIERHPLEEVGYWRIISGSCTFSPAGAKPLKDVVHGRFIDAVYHAVQQPEFAGQLTWKDYHSIDHIIGSRTGIGDPKRYEKCGKVEKINVVEVEGSGLTELVRQDYSVKTEYEASRGEEIRP